MTTRPGGETPSDYGLVITAEAPAGTDSTTPVEVDQVFKLSTSTAYKLVATADGDVPDTAGILVCALERSVDVKPIAVRVLGRHSCIKTLTYSGTDPTIGQSVIADAARGVKAAAYNGINFVLYVDTVKKTCEVLI